MRDIVVIAHNLRSCHNVGSLLRTADGIGVRKVYLTGYTPYPIAQKDTRLPHLSQKLQKQIEKTSLGAENTVKWEHRENVETLIVKLKKDGYSIVALEQDKNSIDITDWIPSASIAVILGRETAGIEPEVLSLSDVVLEIPMFGKKESYNVVQAAAMALFYTRFTK